MGNVACTVTRRRSLLPGPPRHTSGAAAHQTARPGLVEPGRASLPAVRQRGFPYHDCEPGRRPYDSPGPMHPLHALVFVLPLVWLALVAYSRRRWPYLGCRRCGGTGRRFEPLLLTWVCLRARRAWRACDACAGSARRERPRGLALR